MKKAHAIFIIILLLTTLGSYGSSADVNDCQGNAIHLSDYRGKWIVLNYWAAWCHYCLREMPELNSLYIKNADKLIVLGVNFDEAPDSEIQAVANALHLKFPLLRQFPSEKFHLPEVSSLPTTFIIGPDGKLKKTLYGPQTSKEILKEINPL